MTVSIFFALNRQTDYWEGKRNNLKHTTGFNALFLPDTSRHILFKHLLLEWRESIKRNILINTIIKIIESKCHHDTCLWHLQKEDLSVKIMIISENEGANKKSKLYTTDPILAWLT